MKIAVVLSFFLLVICKATVVWIESASDDLMGVAFSASLYALFFGFPQLICLLVVAPKVMTARRAVHTTSAILVLILTAWYFGSLPGTQPPAWGGGGHFEVPVMLLTELIVAAAFALTYPRTP